MVQNSKGTHEKFFSHQFLSTEAVLPICCVFFQRHSMHMQANIYIYTHSFFDPLFTQMVV